MSGEQVIGWILVVVGILSLNSVLFGDDWTGFVFLWAIAAGLVYAYFNRRGIGFLIAGSVVAAIGTFVFLEETWGLPAGLEGSVFFLLLAGAFTAVYLVGTRPSPWPLYVASGLAIFALFVAAAGQAGGPLAKVVFPAALIAVGVLLLARGHRKV